MSATLDNDVGVRTLLYGTDGSSLLKVKTDSSGNLIAINAGSGGVAARQGDLNNVADVSAVLDGLAIGRYDATQPTLTNGRFGAFQLSQKGALSIFATSAQQMVDGDSNNAGYLVDIAGNQRVLPVASVDFNGGTTWDRHRNNIEATTLASAVRAATTASADFVSYNHRGVIVYLNVTVNPGGAQTLALQVQGKDPVSSSYEDLTANAAVLAGGGTGLFAYIVYPGAALTAAVSGDVVQGVPIPRTWRVNVTHSGAGNWTYSVGHALIL